MAHLIILEDNLDSADNGAEYLVDIGHSIKIVTSAEGLWAALAAERIDIAIFDLGSSDDYGLAYISRMRLCYPQIGLLVLTNGIRIEARIRGLRLGADHFMTKPISAPKLAANIEALCRRLYSYQQSVQPAAQTWRLRTCERQLQANGEKTIQLTEKEFNFLHLLAISEQPVAREKLTQDMQLPTSGNDHDNAKRIDMLVYRLRKKVKEGLAKDLPLHSAYGAGYSLSVSLSLI